MTENTDKKITLRYAPSPTGPFHIGRARTVLFNYLFAKQNNAKIVYRSEDTDKARSKLEFEENIKASLAWLGLTYDEFYRQSERTDIYSTYIKKLIDEDKAYISKETPKEEGERDEVIRFKNPNKIVTFTDMIRGEITFDTTELGDFVIAKSTTEALYHLAVVVDDHEMGITHIIRGEDGISNTPRQILIQEAIGAIRPLYAHIPFVLGPDRTKLSGRHGATSVDEYREKGYRSEAIINFLALQGWNPGTDEDVFSVDELIKLFDISKVQKGAAIFNIEKLNWYNREYLKKMDADECISEISKRLPDVPVEVIRRAKDAIIERIEIFDDLVKLNTEGEFDYMINDPGYTADSLLWKNEPDKIKTAERLQKVVELISDVEDFSTNILKNTIWDYASSEGRGEVLWPMRFALSGKDKSPDPFELASILGKETTIKRLANAIEKLKN